MNIVKACILGLALIVGVAHSAETPTKLIVVFTMPGCVPCHKLCATLDEMAIVYGVAEDTSSARRDFGVDGFPTVIVFEGNKEKFRFVGNKSKEEIRALLKKE